MEQPEVVELLKEAVRLLRIMAAPQIQDLRERFGAAMLTSEKRRAMWGAMDGTKSLAEIGRSVGVSGEAVRQFVREVEVSFPQLVETSHEAGGQKPLRAAL